MYALLVTAVAVVVLIIIYLLLVMPDLSGKTRATFLLGKNIAHRGLHSKAKKVPENSLEAAHQSVLCGFGIEFDIQLSLDGRVMVFHDDSLERMTGVKKKVSELTYEELTQLSLEGTRQTLPTFEQYLNIAGGKVPLVVELKNCGARNNELCEKAAALLDEYRGEFVIESFHPGILAWFKKHRPQYIRGQLSCKMRAGEQNFLIRFVLTNLLTNFYTKPHFIAYRYTDVKNWSFRLCRRFGAMTVGWTLDEIDSYKRAVTIFDCIIFENILPANDFRLEEAKKPVYAAGTVPSVKPEMIARGKIDKTE